jgi:hypothetical protein
MGLKQASVLDSPQIFLNRRKPHQKLQVFLITGGNSPNVQIARNGHIRHLEDTGIILFQLLCKKANFWLIKSLSILPLLN